MVSINQSGNHLEIVMSGKLDTDSMKQLLDDLEKKSEVIENGTMLYDVIDFHLLTLGAIGVEFSRLPAMLSLIKRFRRAAVLADQAWIRKIGEFEGHFYPNLEIKAFTREQKSEAEAWLKK